MKSPKKKSSRRVPAPPKALPKIKKLELKLAAKERELQARNEELAAFNEEIQTTNEELRVTNEELRTTNEELISTGDELKAANNHLNTALEELESVSDIPALFLDDKMRIANFTPAMNRLVKLTKSDINRQVDQFSDVRLGKDLVSDAKKVLATSTLLSTEVQCGGTWYLRFMFPRRSEGAKASGVTVSFTDITERKRMEAEIRMLAKLPSENPNPTLRVSKDGEALYANEASAPLMKMWGCAVGCEIPQPLRQEIADAFATETQGTIQIECEKRFYSFVAVPIAEAGYVNLYGRDITVRMIAEEALRKSQRQNEFLASVIESSSQPFAVGYPDGRLGLCNKAFEQLTGYTAAELRLIDWARNLTPPQWADFERKKLEELHATGLPVRYEKEYVRKNGTRVPIELLVHLVKDPEGKPRHYTSFLTDITERKLAEAALRASEERFRTTIDTMLEGCQIIGRDWKYVYVNEAAERHNRRPSSELIGNRYMDMWPGIESTQVFEVIKRCIEERTPETFENEFAFPDGAIGWFDLSIQPVPEGVFILSVDITERKRTEEALRLSEERYRFLFNSLIEGFCIVEMVFDDAGKPVDYRFLEVNEAFEEQTGLHEAQGKLMRDLAPNHEEHWFQIYGQIAMTGKPAKFVNEARALNRWYDVNAFRVGGDGSRKVAICFSDITERKRAEERIRKETELREELAQELPRSNDDLQQFANIVSHDLLEPLRAVSGFIDLIKRHLGEALDAKTIGYMKYVTDGVSRMNALITGLLEYSRIGTRGKMPHRINVKEALDRALLNLQKSVEESGTTVTSSTLPTVMMDPLQLEQLLQNLIGNAIKFRARERQAVITVSAERGDGEWILAVRDNGIGIGPQFKERIFLIFQRLHTESEYPGMGVGLALSKKIVERHGGKIWVESKPGEGATFFFTIPDKGEIRR